MDAYSYIVWFEHKNIVVWVKHPYIHPEREISPQANGTPLSEKRAKNRNPSIFIFILVCFHWIANGGMKDTGLL